MSKTKNRDDIAGSGNLRLLTQLNQAGSQNSTPEEAVNAMLDLVLDALDCDRVWLFYPGEANAKTWSIPLERVRPEYPGAFELGASFSMTQEMSEMVHATAQAQGPLSFDSESEHDVPDSLRNAFSIQAQLSAAMQPHLGKPWMIGVHHCRSPRVWTADDKRILDLSAKRICESLNSLIYRQKLEECESKLTAILGNIEDAHLECDQNGTILRATSSIKYHLGYSAKDLAQTAFSQYFFADLEYEVLWTKLRTQTHVDSLEVNLRSSKGKKTRCLLWAQNHGDTIRFSIRKCESPSEEDADSGGSTPIPKNAQSGLQTVLLATQDPHLEELLGPWIARERLFVTTIRQAQRIVETLESQEFDIVILDKQLTGPHFVATCTFIHDEFPTIPLVTLGVENHAQERIAALDAGADDHISRPIHPEELAARVRALWRRHRLARPSGLDTSRSVERGRLALDPTGYTAKLDSKELELTTTEFGILLELAKVPGRVFSREQLLDLVWGEDFFGSPRTVDSHIRNLRLKLKACDNGYEPIISVRGVGYKFNEPLT